MTLLRQLFMVTLATAIAASSAFCFSQATKEDKDIYNENADARSEIKEALRKAAAEHKRVIVSTTSP